MAPPIKRPRRRLREVVSEFHRDTLEQLDINLDTQHVWPEEVYPGYRRENEWRKAHGQWFSTGDSRRSLKGRILAADEAGNVSLDYEYLAYLRYAEMGIGAGTKAGDVERARKARYDRRYTRLWNRGKGRSFRPALRMEFNHLERRLGNYLSDHYGHQFCEAVPYWEVDIEW